MKYIVKLIVDYVVDLLKTWMYNNKLRSVNKKIKKAKKEAQDAQKDSDTEYNNFMLSYARYRAELQQSSKQLRDRSGEAEVDHRKEGSANSKDGGKAGVDGEKG